MCIRDRKNPPVAVKTMTPFDALMKCSMTDHVIWLIRRMNAQGFSHVPIVSSGYLVGVFSTATVFSYLEKYGEKSITGETEISEFSEFLPVEAHITESYRFCAPDASYYNCLLYTSSFRTGCALLFRIPLYHRNSFFQVLRRFG